MTELELFDKLLSIRDRALKECPPIALELNDLIKERWGKQ